MKNLVAEIYLDVEASLVQSDMTKSVIGRLYMVKPGGRGSRVSDLTTRDMRRLAYELLSNAEFLEGIAELKTAGATKKTKR